MRIINLSRRQVKVLMPFIALAVASCSSPTAPAPVVQPNSIPVAVVTPPEPVPVPTPPVQPQPQPEPAHPFHFQAEVGSAHWYGPAVFPGHFEVWINPGRVEAGAHGFDILFGSGADGSVIAGTRNVETLTLVKSKEGVWTWTYNGLAGQASGAMVQR